MAKYVPPHEVTSPRRQWSLIAVIDDPEEEGSCVLALGRWENKPVLAMRWNGNAGNRIGNPQSRGLSTWFIVDDRFYDAIIGTLSSEMQVLARNFFPKAA